MFRGLVVPNNYESKLTLRETEKAIKQVKDYFQRELANALNLERVSAPLFVFPESGLNDDLNGVERPVSFDVPDLAHDGIEVVHSLAKWKRMTLNRYEFAPNEGLYTDMNAIRRDEELDNLHSLYVDQWDWEKIIAPADRTMETLVKTVKKIYRVFKMTENYMDTLYPVIKPTLPAEIFFITSQELETRYPDLTPEQREDAITKEKKAVFLMQIGGALTSGEPHDGRAPDYDDWTLNGDILFWHPILDQTFELSSMGIRVDPETLKMQLAQRGCQDRSELPFHKALLAGELPQTMGGGIGQSRMCMFFLQKAHIGEVQASLWPAEMVSDCEKAGVFLL
jgi:aspartate--ammonia ligase